MSKVSVTMGVYNCEASLAEAVDSILNQSFTDWELIMCDDGSSDGSYAIAKEYEKRFPDKIRVIKNERNMGLNETLNRCIGEAKGEYIAGMDADDISVAERLEKEYEFLEEHKEYGFVCCDMIMFDESGEWGRTHSKAEPDIKDIYVSGGAYCHATRLVRKEAYKAVGGYTVDKRLLRVEDYNLWQKLYVKGYKGYNLHEALYKMRDDKNAIKRRSLRNRLNGTYAVYTGFKMLNLPWYYFGYVVKDAVVGVAKNIIPMPVYKYFHQRRLERK